MRTRMAKYGARGIPALLVAAGLLLAACVPGPPVDGSGNRVDLRPKVGFAPGNRLLFLSEADLNRELDGMRDAGARWLRVEIPWSVVQEDGPNAFDWSKPDRVIIAARNRGINVLGLVTYTPSWARPAGTSDKWGPSTSDAILRFGLFSALAAKRYAPIGVNHFQIWNEANIWIFWEPAPNPELYTVLLKITAQFLRAANPNVKIVTTGMAPANDSVLSYVNRTFLSRMYAAGAKGSFDFVGVHPYSFPAHPLLPAPWNTFYRLPDLYQVMVANGDGDKKMWSTESGFPTGTYPQASTEANQADWLDDLVWSWFDYDFTDVFMWFSYRDGGTDLADPNENMGIVRNDFTAKPARDSFRWAVDPSVPIPTTTTTTTAAP